MFALGDHNILQPTQTSQYIFLERSAAVRCIRGFIGTADWHRRRRPFQRAGDTATRAIGTGELPTTPQLSCSTKPARNGARARWSCTVLFNTTHYDCFFAEGESHYIPLTEREEVRCEGRGPMKCVSPRGTSAELPRSPSLGLRAGIKHPTPADRKSVV